MPFDDIRAALDAIPYDTDLSRQPPVVRVRVAGEWLREVCAWLHDRGLRGDEVETVIEGVAADWRGKHRRETTPKCWRSR
jgi:hypothetical protein